MRRPYLALALILASALAGGQAPAPSRAPIPPRRPLQTVYASDFGDSPANADNTAALRAAIEKAAAIGLVAFQQQPPITPRVTVFVQAGTHRVSGPINVPSFVELKGEGGSTKIAMAQGLAYTPVVVGMPLGGLDPKYRPDLTGVLDASAGARRGLRTFADAYLQSPASALSHGGYSPAEGTTFADRWTGTRVLVVEAALMAGDGGQISGGISLFGLGSDTTGPATCFALRTDGPNQFTFVVSYQTARFATPQTVFTTFSAGSAAGLQRLTFQVDMDKGTVAAFANGTQAATRALASYTMAIPPGSSLNENSYDSFFVGNPGGGRGDFTLGGFCLTRTKRYLENGPGTPQVRADGKPIADGPRFFPALADDAHAIGYLPLNEADLTQRHIPVARGWDSIGGSSSSAWVMNGGAPDFKSSAAWITDIAIQGNMGYGYAVMMGNNLDTRFSGVIADGGLIGVGNLQYGANYPVSVRGCTLSGTDCGYFGFKSIVDMDSVTFPYNGRAAMRFVGCQAAVRGVFVTRASSPQYAFSMIHAGDYGGFYSFRDVTVDNEGDVYSLAGIYCERQSGGTTLAAENVSFGTNGAAPAILLKGMNPNWQGQAMLDASRVYASGTGPLVATDDGQWAGTIAKSPANVLPAVVSTGAAKPAVSADLPPYLTRGVKPAPAPAPAPVPAVPD